MIATTQSPNAELDGTLPNGQTFEYATVIVGRDLSSYLIALILSQHGHQAVIVSGPSAPVMDDLHEYLALKYLHEAARRHRSIRSLTKQGFQIDFDRSASPVDWQQLRRQCHDEFLHTKENLERLVAERDITVYEGTIVMLEDYLVRIVSEGTRRSQSFIHVHSACCSLSKTNSLIMRPCGRSVSFWVVTYAVAPYVMSQRKQIEAAYCEP